jgi:hypothetical protein
VHRNGGGVFAGVVRIFGCRRKEQNENPVPSIMMKATPAKNSTEQSMGNQTHAKEKKRDCAQKLAALCGNCKRSPI